MNDDKEKEKEKEKEKVKEKEEKTHRHSRKRYKKTREKRRSKRRRRDRQKVRFSHQNYEYDHSDFICSKQFTGYLLLPLSPQHHSPSSSSSSDSYDSDYDRPERPKNRKNQGASRESDGQSSQVSSAPRHADAKYSQRTYFVTVCSLDFPNSMDGIQREATQSRHLTRVVILTNTVTTVMTDMTTKKRRMITKMTCPSTRSQRIQLPRVRGGDAMLRSI